MKVARFPAYKDLSGFDFATSDINGQRSGNSIAASSWKRLRMSC